jgi:hypothetical protein
MSNSQPMHQAAPTNSLAVISLVFGILAWTVLPFVGAVIAWVCGRLGLKEIRNAPAGTVQGEGMARAGQILAGLQFLMLIPLLLLLLFMIVAPHLHPVVYLNHS